MTDDTAASVSKIPLPFFGPYEVSIAALPGGGVQITIEPRRQQADTTPQPEAAAEQRPAAPRQPDFFHQTVPVTRQVPEPEQPTLEELARLIQSHCRTLKTMVDETGEYYFGPPDCVKGETYLMNLRAYGMSQDWPDYDRIQKLSELSRDQLVSYANHLLVEIDRLKGLEFNMALERDGA